MCLDLSSCRGLSDAALLRLLPAAPGNVGGGDASVSKAFKPLSSADIAGGGGDTLNGSILLKVITRLET